MSAEPAMVCSPLFSRMRLGITALAVVAASACGSQAPQSMPGAHPTIALSSCTVAGRISARCGSLVVAENPAVPRGRHITIQVVVLPASGKTRAPDPLFYFAGGPGGAASDSVVWASTEFGALNADRDIVFVDQRGTGGSNAMECPALMDAGITTSGVVPSATTEAAAAQACLASTSPYGDAATYTTPLFADDVDQVRAALGYQSIDIYGGSYGVSSGLAYIQRHGDHVRTALLDSGSLLDVRLWERSAASLQASLESVLSRCAADAACHAAFPDVAAELASVFARITTTPVSLDGADPRSPGSVVHVTVNPTTFGGALADLLSDTGSMALVPAAIHMAYLGEWARLAQTLAAAQPATNPQVTMVMARTIQCSDAWAQMDPAAVQSIGGTSIFNPAQVARAALQHEFCPAWPAATGASGPVRSSVPIVFLNGTADPADPPANVAGAAATMPNSLLVPVQGYGHGQLAQDSSGCLEREATNFIKSGVPAKLADWSCALDSPFPPFSQT